jgi:hypothetical protein
MRAKRFPLLTIAVMITVVPACDNVAFGGVQVELQAPVRTSTTLDPDTTSAAQREREQPPEPIELTPLLYLVQQTDGSRATILPIAQVTPDGYEPVPGPEEIPDLVDRFAVGRWEAGTELSLFAQGSRIGTFVADGTTEIDNSTCQARPRGQGYIEVRPDAAVLRQFLAIREPTPASREGWVAVPRFGEDATLRDASLNLAQRLIPQLGVLWPPSIPEIRRDLQPFRLGEDGPSGLAVSYVFGDRLRTGTPNPRAYSLFILAGEGETRYEPIVTWYQRAPSGKAFPRFVGAHDARGVGSPDVVLEVFGEADRWLAVLGAEDDEWSILYRDACGEPAARGAIRTYR